MTPLVAIPLNGLLPSSFAFFFFSLLLGWGGMLLAAICFANLKGGFPSSPFPECVTWRDVCYPTACFSGTSTHDMFQTFSFLCRLLRLLLSSFQLTIRRELTFFLVVCFCEQAIQLSFFSGSQHFRFISAPFFSRPEKAKRCSEMSAASFRGFYSVFPAYIIVSSGYSAFQRCQQGR